MEINQTQLSKQANGKHNNKVEEEEEEVCRKAKEIARGMAFPMTLKSAMELNILEIISDASDHGVYLSSSEVVAKIDGCVNPNAPALVDRMLCLLTSFSILKCKLKSDEEGVERVYGAAPLCKYFLSNKVGAQENSFGAWFLLQNDKTTHDSWNNINEVVLEGGSTPFVRAYGMTTFEYIKKNSKLSKIFNEAMSNQAIVTVKKIVDTYEGFEGIKALVDVGGGVGTTLKLIISKYPKIKGINFDQPHVVVEAPIYPGIEHFGGDMFERVPSGDAIIIKWVLHNWDDECCLKILKNCWEALPKSGKVIVVESLIQLIPENDYNSQEILAQDLTLFITLGSKKKTKEELEALAFHSGFSSCVVICSVDGNSIIELIKA